MTCRRLEDDDLLAGLGDEIDGHVEQCPDCSARAQGYRRIAAWIADGRTPHRPPADWQRRTLAHVLATQGPLRSIPADATGPAAAGHADRATERPTDLPGATASESAGTRARAASMPPRPRWSRVLLPVVLPIASAAIVAWIAWGALRGDPQPPRVAIENRERAPGDVMVAPGRESRVAPAESPAQPGAVPAAEDASRAPERAASPQRPGDPRQAPESVAQSTKRGGAVVVDWPAEATTSPATPRALGQVRFDPPSGSFAGLTIDEIRQVVETRAGLFRACYEDELRRTPEIHGKLLVHIQIAGDGQVQAVDTARPGSTLHSDPVAQCVRVAVENARFPAKGGIARVSYVFEFVP